MKRTVSIIVSGMLLSQPLFAQTVVPVVGGKGGAFVGNAGNYDITQVTTNNTTVALELIRTQKDLQEIDRQYLLSMIERLNAQLNDLVKMKKNYDALSQRSQVSGPVKIEEYLVLANDVNAANASIQNNLQLSALVNRATLPTAASVDAAGVPVKINNSGNIDMSRVTSQIDSQRQQLIAAFNAVTFKVISPLSQTRDIVSNSLDTALAVKGLRILTADQIQTYTNEIGQKLTLAPETIGYQRRSVEYTVTLIKQMVNNYGKKEWLRFQNENDSAALQKIFKDIIDALYQRSYMRKKFGTRMGAIQTMEYKKLPINLEDLTIQPLRIAMGSLSQQAAVSQDEVNQAFENTRNFLELFDKKITPVKASSREILAQKPDEQFLSKNTGFMVRANSAITYMTGQRKTAQVLRDVMILVLADIQEERALIANSQTEANSLHDSRYRATADLKSIANKRICEIDFTLSVDAHNANCVPLGIKVKAKRPAIVTGRSTGEIMAGLIAQYTNVETGKRQEARFKQELIDAALDAGMTDQERQEKKSLEDSIFE